MFRRVTNVLLVAALVAGSLAGTIGGASAKTVCRTVDALYSAETGQNPTRAMTMHQLRSKVIQYASRQGFRPRGNVYSRCMKFGSIWTCQAKVRMCKRKSKALPAWNI